MDHLHQSDASRGIFILTQNPIISLPGDKSIKIDIGRSETKKLEITNITAVPGSYESFGTIQNNKYRTFSFIVTLCYLQ